MSRDMRSKLFLIFLTSLLIALASDCESNPGPLSDTQSLSPSNVNATLLSTPEPLPIHTPVSPATPNGSGRSSVGEGSTIYPCGSCGLPVTWDAEDYCITCDTCCAWFHGPCQNIGNSTYADMEADHFRFNWTCNKCGARNANTSIYNVSTHNNFSVLLNESLDDSLLFSPGTPQGTSSPLTTNAGNNNRTRKGKKKNIFKPLRLLNINCRSLRNKDRVAELHTIIDRVRPDILVLTETWLDKSITASSIIPDHLNMTPYKADRPDQPWGGVMIAVSNEFISTEVPELKTDCESIWISINLAGAKKLLVCAYYRPDERDEKSLLELDKALSKVGDKNCHIWIAGDFNFPDFDWSDNHHPYIRPGSSSGPLHRKFLEILNEHSLTQVVNKPTRNKATLDLMLMNIESCLNRVEILPPFADHDTVLIEADITPQRVKAPPRNVYLWRKGDWDTARAEFEKFAREYLDMDKDNASINTLWGLIRDKIQFIVKEYVPSKVIKSKFNVPWIDDEIRKLIKKRDRFRSRTKHRRWDPHIAARYRTMKAEIQRAIRTKYWKYVHFTLLGLQDPDETADTSAPVKNSKRFFSFLKSQRSESCGVAPLKKDGMLISDSQGKANVLNDQFTSVFTRDDPSHIPDLGPSPHPSMPRVVVTLKGVHDLLGNLQPNKAAGPDGIHPRVLKEIKDDLAPVLVDFFQRSLNSGEVPDDWKEANVSPAFKKEDKYKASNYRPISLTSIVCKLLEHIVASNMMTHLDNNNILYDLQHGFRGKRSTVTQLISLYDDLVTTRSKKVQTDLVVMDFAKAFDKVCHRLLGMKLSHYGVRDHELQWIESFLSGQSQTDAVEGKR